MEQVQGRDQGQGTSMTKRLYEIVKSELATASTAGAVTYTIGFGKTGLFIPMIYRISKKISDFIGGEVLCVNNIVKLGIPKNVASTICNLYKKLFFLYLFVQMTNFSYVNIFSETPTVLNFFLNYTKNVGQLVYNLSTDFLDCNIQALNEVIKMSKGVGGYTEIGSDLFEDYQNITLSYILTELTNIAIGFSANVGLLAYVNSIGEYVKNIYSVTKNTPSDVRKWISVWSESFIESGVANVAIENKGEIVTEFTNAKTITSYNQTIVNNLDDVTGSIGNKNFKKIHEGKESVDVLSNSFQEKSYDVMNWIEKAWSIVNITSPSNSSLPIVHQNIVRATSETVDTLLDGMKKSKSKMVKKVGNTVTMSGGYCRKKIKNTLDNFNNLFETDVKIYDNAMEINRDYLKFLPQYEIKSTSLPLQIDPTTNGKSYNPSPDMLITVNILTLIILILVFVQSIIIPLARIGKSVSKSIYQKISRRN